MASKKYNGKIDLLLDIKPSELESMTRKDLAQVVTRLRDAGQKRLKRIEKAGEYSPSAEYVKRTGGFKQIRGLNVTELRNEYLRLKGFIGAKTSTVKGTKQYQKKQKEIIQKMAEASTHPMNTGKTSYNGQEYIYSEEGLPDGWMGKVWELLDRAADGHMINRQRYQSYVGLALQSIRANGIDDKERLFKDFVNRVESEYEKLKKEDPSLVNPSSIFK